MAKMQQSPDYRTFEDDEQAALAQYIGYLPIYVRIHVVGPTGDARIVVQPAVAVTRQNRERIEWVAGANCGDWEVSYVGQSPLDPALQTYSSGGTTGGLATGAEGIHKYEVRARDLRDSSRWSVDPDHVIVPTS